MEAAILDNRNKVIFFSKMDDLRMSLFVSLRTKMADVTVRNRFVRTEVFAVAFTE